MTDSLAAAVNGSTDSAADPALQQILGNLSWPGFALLALLILSVMILILAVIFRPRGSKTKPSSPYVKAFVITALFTVFIIVIENMYGPDRIPDWLQIGMSVLLFFALIAFFRSEDRIIQERVTRTYVLFIRDHLRTHYDSELNVGESQGSRIPEIKVLPNTEYGGTDDSVAHYLALTNRNVYVHYAFGLKSGILLEADEDPKPEKIDRIFKRRPRRLAPAQQQSSLPAESVSRLRQPNDQPTTAPS